jgi:hypothetical protein
MHLMRKETVAYGARPKRLIAKSSLSAGPTQKEREAILLGYFTDKGKLVYAGP